MAISSRSLLDAVHLVKAKLATLPPLDPSFRAPFDAAVHGICAELQAEGASVGHRHDGDFIRFAGVRASSTGGRVAALTNWVDAAYRRLDRAAAGDRL